MIHKTAIIDSKAKISSSARIGSYSVIGPNVEIGDDTIIHSQVNITGNTKIGNGGPGYTLPAEFSPQFFHKKGALAAARMGDAVNPKKNLQAHNFILWKARFMMKKS